MQAKLQSYSYIRSHEGLTFPTKIDTPIFHLG